MQNNIRNTNLRFNLDKDQQRRAWEYLQTMDRQNFKSYSQVISLALVDYFDRYYRTQADPYLETREREELFVKQIVDAVENSLKQSLPLFLSGLTAGMAQREPQSQYHQLCWWFVFALPGRIAFPPEGGLTNHSFSYWWPLKSGSFLLF